MTPIGYCLTGPAGALRRRMAPGAAARPRGVGLWAAGRRYGRPGRPHHALLGSTQPRQAPALDEG
jgi:hypothetical protein